MAKVTFGKYSGWDTEKLASFTDGRSYLAWGAEKLQSPKWQQEFRRALSSVPASEMDIDLEAQAIMKSDAQIDPEDAYILARDTRAQLIEDEQRYAAIDAARQRFFDALAKVGIDTGNARRLYGLIQEGFAIEELAELEKDGRVRFTSQAKRNAVWQAAIGLDGDADNIKF